MQTFFVALHSALRLKQLLSIGNTVDPADAYRAFRGRDPRVEALMKKRGFTSAAAASQTSH
jgi:peptidyl-dipeptidase Dcp